jgi:hypothetical protein
MTRESEAFNSKARRLQRKLQRLHRSSEQIHYEIHIQLGRDCTVCAGPCSLVDQDAKTIITVWGRGGSASETWKNRDQAIQSDQAEQD